MAAIIHETANKSNSNRVVLWVFIKDSIAYVACGSAIKLVSQVEGRKSWAKVSINSEDFVVPFSLTKYTQSLLLLYLVS